MRAGLDPFSFLVISIAGWINQRQQQVIEYLVEENRVLREQIGNRRIRFTDDQRRRLAARGTVSIPEIWMRLWDDGVIAYPMGSGARVRIFSQDVRLAWSWDRKLLFLSYATTTTGGISSAAGKTYVIPLPPGHMLPEIPASGFRTSDDIARLPGDRVIDSADATPGATSGTYAFSRETTQRNLYRVPIP
jgi:hypothetical protein